MKKIFFLSLTLLFFIPEILADKRAPINIPCVSMLAEVDANEARASAKYSDKTIKISGRIDRIIDTFGENVVSLSSGVKYGFTSCRLYDVPLDTILSLDKGQNVTFECDSFDEIMGSALLSNCKKI